MRAPRITISRMMAMIAVVGLLLGGIVYAFKPEYSRLSLVNRSGQTISALTINVHRQDIVFQNIADGSTVTAPYATRRADMFGLNGSLADGTPVGAKDHRLGFRVRPKTFPHPIITIKPGGKVTLSLVGLDVRGKCPWGP